MSEERKMTLTSEEKKSSLEAQFWCDNQEIDRNTPFMKKIEKLCEGIFDKK